ncbi:hypothetical protein [Archangium primigenium]|uniref:hypothetical protein n=1 Tax=[Archangium] primigenium TaxID=2792470 RepID=UPI00195C66A1|nr:hypothetical protein [Archangium primigenium]MBM7115734.1 hypothetical protein [Archangium primigenium]
MKTWVELYTSHRQVRAGPPTWTGEVRKRLIALAEAGHCDKSIRGRFSQQRSGELVEWSIRKDNAQAAEPLTGLADLKTAQISVLGLVSRKGHLHSFTVSVEGKRSDGSSWAVAVHLPDDRETEKKPNGDRQGLGACSHAALHCHVGPDLDTGPEVRVPLPALTPGEVLDWVLSQLVPTQAFEPAPWPSVLDAMKKASS